MSVTASYLLTFEGQELIEFLKRRGYGEPMSPRAEEDFRGTYLEE